MAYHKTVNENTARTQRGLMHLHAEGQRRANEILFRSLDAEIARGQLQCQHNVERALAEGNQRHGIWDEAAGSSLPNITTDDLSVHPQIQPPDSQYTISIQGQQAVNTEDVPFHAFQQEAFGPQYSYDEHHRDVDPDLETAVRVPIWETLSGALNDLNV